MPDNTFMESEQTFIKTRASETITLTRKSRGVSMAAGQAGSGQAQWEDIMKKFYEAHKQTCRTIPKEKKIPKMARELKQFPTGSTYTGDWNLLGMSGKGVYIFPQKGITYKGEFDDGMFEGTGDLHYDCGAIVKGKWKKGKLIEKSLVFADGLHYEEKDWAYCRIPDRRYTAEHDEKIQPAGRSYITAEMPPQKIPPGFYDAGDGVYDPKTKMVYKYDDLTAIVRSPDAPEQIWIAANCRFNCNIPLGPCTFLYEDWMEPTLEIEDPPPPLVRTKTYQEEFAVDRDVSYFGKTSSRSSSTASKRGLASKTSLPLFAKSFDHRRYTDLEENDFYKPVVQSVSGTSTANLKRGSKVFEFNPKQSRQLSRVSYIDDTMMAFRPSKATFESSPASSAIGSGTEVPNADLDDIYHQDTTPKGRPPPNW